MDSSCSLLLGALRTMESRLCAVIDGRCSGSARRVAESEQRAAGYVNDEGPIFDDEQFVDTVFDTTFYHFDDGPVFDTYPDDLDGETIFDEELFVATEPDSDPVAVANSEGAVLGAVPLFDEEHEPVEADLTSVKQFVLDSQFTATTTTTGTLVTCSTNCLHLAVNTGKTLVTTPLQEFKGITDVWVLDLICKVFNTYCSSIANCGKLFLDNCELLMPVHSTTTSSLVENRLVISDSVENSGFESKFWDPGLAGGLEYRDLIITRWVVHSRAAFNWDPGSPDDFVPAYLHGLPIKGLQMFWDPGLLEDSKFMEFTSSPESFSCTYVDGVVSVQHKPPWLMGDVVVRKWVQQSKLVSVERWQRKCGGFCWSFLLQMCQLEVFGENLDSHVFVSTKLQSVDNIFARVGMSIGELVSLLKDLDYHIFACAQLQVAVSYWYTETFVRWESQWIFSSVSGVLLSGCVLNWSQVPCIAICSVQISVTVIGLVFVGRAAAVRKHKSQLVDGIGDTDLHGNQLLTELYSFQGDIGMILIAITTITDYALLHNSQEVFGQWGLLWSEAAMLDQKFPTSMKIRNPIQGHYVLILINSGSSYIFIAITVAAKLLGVFPLSKSWFINIANGARLQSAVIPTNSKLWYLGLLLSSVAALGTLNSLVATYGGQIGSSSYETMIAELSSLISDMDLHMTAFALELCCTIMVDRKFIQNVGLAVRNKILPQALVLIRSDLLQEQALQALQKFFASLDYSATNSAKQHMALLWLGEIGRKDLSNHVQSENIVNKSFQSPFEETKSAQSYALGNIAVGNLSKYLPFISDQIDNQQKKQYMLLHSLKEVSFLLICYPCASQTGHVRALYTAFLAMHIAAGAPCVLSALALAFNTNLFGALTHYSSGQAVVYFGADKYIVHIAPMLKFPDAKLINGGNVRNVLNVGCGVASFGAVMEFLLAFTKKLIDGTLEKIPCLTELWAFEVDPMVSVMIVVEATLEFYVGNGELDAQLFYEMEDHAEIAWNAMIKGYSQLFYNYGRAGRLVYDWGGLLLKIPLNKCYQLEIQSLVWQKMPQLQMLGQLMKRDANAQRLGDKPPFKERGMLVPVGRMGCLGLELACCVTF